MDERLSRLIIISLRGPAWAPVSVLLLHVVLAEGLGAYRIYPNIDIPMHFLGGIVITYFAAYAAAAAARLELLGRPNQAATAILSFAAGCSAVVFWEFAECALDLTLGTRHQAGLPDTMLDMFLGVLGSAFYLAATRLFSGQRSEYRENRPGIAPVDGYEAARMDL